MTQIPKGKVRVNLYLPPDIRDWFRAACKEQGISQPTAFEMLVTSWRDGHLSLPGEPQVATDAGDTAASDTAASNGKASDLAVVVAEMQAELGELRDRLSALEQEPTAADALAEIVASASNGKTPTATPKKAASPTASKSTAKSTATRGASKAKTATAASSKSTASKSTASKSTASKSTAKSPTGKSAATKSTAKKTTTAQKATTPKTGSATKKKSPAKSTAKKSTASSKATAATKKKSGDDAPDAGSLTSREAWQLACDRGYKGEFESFRKTATRPGWERYGIQKVGARPRRDARNWERLY